MLNSMRKMGIDFGTKKVGIALTNESGTMAFPHDVIPNDGKLLERVVSLIEKENVVEVVMGHSLTTSGEENKVHQLAQEFMLDMTMQLPIPVHLEPEQFSTQQAIKLQGRNDMTDASAAAIILDSYLQKQNTTSAFDDLNS